MVCSPRERIITPAALPRSRHELNEQLYGSKEVHYFDHYGRVEDLDSDSYHRYFPRPPDKITGEWTARYMFDFWTVPMLHAVAPEAKILVILRDPVARFTSALAHHIAWGGLLDHEAIDHQYRRGLYWHQLAVLRSYFDPEQILVLQYERCVRDLEAEARRTFEFLGLSAVGWLATPKNRTRVGPTHPLPPIDQPTCDAVRRAYRPDLERLLEEFPAVDGSLWPSAE